jgi:hypothetical protein
MKNGLIISLCILTTSFLFDSDLCSQSLPEQLVKNAIQVALTKLESSIDEVKDRTRYPSYAPDDLMWSYSNSAGWTSGFYSIKLFYTPNHRIS